jgi:hypothetical protein
MYDNVDLKAMVYALIIALLVTLISFQFFLNLLDKMFIFLVLLLPLLIMLITTLLLYKRSLG